MSRDLINNVLEFQPQTTLLTVTDQLELEFSRDTFCNLD